MTRTYRILSIRKYVYVSDVTHASDVCSCMRHARGACSDLTYARDT